MATTTVDILQANSVNTDELSAGNMLVSGAARFVQPIYADINGAHSIHDSTASNSISNSDYIFISSSGSLKKILYSDFVTDISSKISVNISDSEGVGY